jgi:hypothetical protein
MALDSDLILPEQARLAGFREGRSELRDKALFIEAPVLEGLVYHPNKKGIEGVGRFASVEWNGKTNSLLIKTMDGETGRIKIDLAVGLVHYACIGDEVVNETLTYEKNPDVRDWINQRHADNPGPKMYYTQGTRKLHVVRDDKGRSYAEKVNVPEGVQIAVPEWLDRSVMLIRNTKGEFSAKAGFDFTGQGVSRNIAVCVHPATYKGSGKIKFWYNLDCTHDFVDSISEIFPKVMK